MLSGQLDEVGCIGDFKFHQQIFAVGVYRRDTDKDLVRDLPVGESFGNQDQHLFFTARQKGRGLGLSAAGVSFRFTFM